jgi:zinc transport system permease protein
MIEILQLPFMQRAIIGGIIVALLCAILGVFVTLRKESFIADAIAHGSLAGVAIALVAGYNPILPAVLVAVLMAIGITYVKQNTVVSSDAIIGIFFSVIFAIAIVIINSSTKFRPELSSFLFGSILLITWLDIIYAGVILLLLTLFIKIFYYKLLYLIFDAEAAKVRGVPVKTLEYLLNIFVAIAIVVSIKVVGIILLTAMLIIPATNAKMIASKFSQMIPLAIVHNLVSVVLGMYMSYVFNAPAGATIVITSGIIFLLVLIILKLFRKN